MMPTEPGWVSVRVSVRYKGDMILADGEWPWCAGRVYGADGRLEVEWPQRGIRGGILVLRGPVAGNDDIEFGRPLDVGPEAPADLRIRIARHTVDQMDADVVTPGRDKRGE